MNGENQTSGFWFAYIETLTGLAVIFLILFVAAANRERAINEQQEGLVKSWQTAKEKLFDLQAAPVPDPKMGGMRITLADSLIFALKSSKLSGEGENKIIEISRVLVGFYKSNPSFKTAMRIKVGGHTDPIGGDTINFPLSYQRAYNVMSLINSQFTSERLDVETIPIAYGSKYPLPGHDSEIEPKNRRITIVVEFLSTELLIGLK
ncbi:MAG: OmpA family protein [Bacteroidota bacterium]|nr:OmpA family protein [Bacteroidota bacterium]